MIQDTDQTVCTVTYHESANGDDIAIDWPTALTLATNHLEVDDPRIKQLGCGFTMLYEETDNEDEDNPRVSIRERSIKEEK